MAKIMISTIAIVVPVTKVNAVLTSLVWQEEPDQCSVRFLASFVTAHWQTKHSLGPFRTGTHCPRPEHSVVPFWHLLALVKHVELEKMGAFPGGPGSGACVDSGALASRLIEVVLGESKTTAKLSPRKEALLKVDLTAKVMAVNASLSLPYCSAKAGRVDSEKAPNRLLSPPFPSTNSTRELKDFINDSAAGDSVAKSKKSSSL